jgi:hypothetical protein
VGVHVKMSVQAEPYPILLPPASSLEPLQSSTTPWSSAAVSANEPVIAINIAAEATTDTSRTNQDGQPAQPSAQASSEVVVLTPSRLRVDSRVVLAQATIQWPSNCLFCLLLWLKVNWLSAWSESSSRQIPIVAILMRVRRCLKTSISRVPTSFVRHIDFNHGQARKEHNNAYSDNPKLIFVHSDVQMDQTITWSWWAVFAPAWISHVLLLPLQVAVTLSAVSPQESPLHHSSHTHSHHTHTHK